MSAPTPPSPAAPRGEAPPRGRFALVTTRPVAITMFMVAIAVFGIHSGAAFAAGTALQAADAPA